MVRRTTVSAFVVAVAAVGCGDNGDARVDGPVADGPGTIDAMVDARIDAAAAEARYVLSGAEVPTTTTEAQALGMDIDGGEPGGDPAVDNQLGAVLAAVAAQGFDVQAGVTYSIDHGESITLFELRVDDTFHTIPGADPMPPACASPSDTICRRHLTGAGSFDMLAGAPTGSMPTTMAGGVTMGGPGTAVVDLLLLGNSEPLHLALIGARFQGTVASTGITFAKIAGAVTVTQINDEVIPAVATAFRAQVAADCDGTTPPTCSCTSGSQGETLIDLFDVAPADCMITDDEVRNNSLIQSLFAPDVTIGGVDGLSLGVGVEAVPATFRFTPQ